MGEDIIAPMSIPPDFCVPSIDCPSFPLIINNEVWVIRVYKQPVRPWKKKGFGMGVAKDIWEDCCVIEVPVLIDNEQAAQATFPWQELSIDEKKAFIKEVKNIYGDIEKHYFDSSKYDPEILVLSGNSHKINLSRVKADIHCNPRATKPQEDMDVVNQPINPNDFDSNAFVEVTLEDGTRRAYFQSEDDLVLFKMKYCR